MVKKRQRPDPDVLRHQCEVERIHITELTKMYGYANWSNLYAWCRKWGIKTERHPNDSLREMDLSEEQHQIVLGTLLGDGHILSRPKVTKSSCRLTMGHGGKQRDYLEWKKRRLEPFITMPEPDVLIETTFSAGSPIYRYHSIGHPAFTQYRELFYPNGVKRIRQSILDRLKPLALAVWLMDDGSFHKTRQYIYLSTNGFLFAELELAAEWFGKLLGIEPYIHSAGRFAQFHLAFNRSAADALRLLVRPHFFEPLLYKIGC